MTRGGLRALFASTSGGAAIELAMSAPVMLAFLIGLLDVAQMLWINHSLQNAAESTARYALVTRITDPGALSTQMTTILASSPGADATVSVTPSTAGGISYLEIAGRLAYTPLGGYIGIPEVTLGGRAVIPVTGGS